MGINLFSGNSDLEKEHYFSARTKVPIEYSEIKNYNRFLNVNRI